MRRIKVFSDLSHPDLVKEICRELNIEPGVSEITTFSNGNLIADVQESVQGKDVFIVGTQAPPAAQNFLALCILIDALHYAAAKRVTAVLPYLFESRSDKKDRSRVSIVARLIAQFLETAGADRVLTMDLHAPQIQGFFRIPVDTLEGAPLIAQLLNQRDLDNYVIVAGDSGEAKRLEPLLSLLPRRLPIAVFDKRRDDHQEKPRIVGIVGSVAGKIALITDDEIASGGTVHEATEFFGKMPAEEQPLEIRVAATHPVLSGSAIQTLNQSGIKELVTVATIPVPEEKIKAANFAITILSPAKPLAQAIKTIHEKNFLPWPPPSEKTF